MLASLVCVIPAPPIALCHFDPISMSKLDPDGNLTLYPKPGHTHNIEHNEEEEIVPSMNCLNANQKERRPNHRRRVTVVVSPEISTHERPLRI